MNSTPSTAQERCDCRNFEVQVRYSKLKKLSVTSFKFFNDYHKNNNNTNSIRTNIYYIIIHVIAIIIMIIILNNNKNVTIMLSLA